jgi:hypothetical protein
MVMQVIERWSINDARINEMTAHFLDSDVRKIVAMLQSLEATAAKRAAIRAAAKTSLSESDYLLFEATLKTTKASEERRHHFAHHIWAISDQLPNDALLIDPKYEHRHRAFYEDVGRRSKAGRSTSVDEIGEAPNPLDGMYVFTEQDVRNDVATAARASNVLANLSLFVADLRRDPSQADSTRNWLSAEPQIAQALHTLREKRQKQVPP